MSAAEEITNDGCDPRLIDKVTSEEIRRVAGMIERLAKPLAGVRALFVAMCGPERGANKFDRVTSHIADAARWHQLGRRERAGGCIGAACDLLRDMEAPPILDALHVAITGTAPTEARVWTRGGMR